jgi:dTMP kinase
MFLSLDGVDGAGKSTQIERLAEWLRAAGRDVVLCRDPGTTPLGLELRKILLHREDLGIERRSEMFLYMAARTQLVEEFIRPALAAGKTVVSDRFLLANVVYQGHAGGLDPDVLWQVGRIATNGLEPDLTIVLDVPVEIAAERLGPVRDRIESRGTSYLQAVRDGFLAESRRQPRLVVIDARVSPDAVFAAIRATVERLAAFQSRQ